jgi:hypothetical protein
MWAISIGDVEMFDRLFSLFNRGKKSSTAQSSFMRPKGEPVKTPTVMSMDRKGPAQVSTQEPRPQALLVENTRLVPISVSEPDMDFKPMVHLPPDIDPNEVIIVQHEAKKTGGERFKYVDKTLKSSGSDGKNSPNFIKYNDRQTTDVIKYNAAPAASYQKPERSAKAANDVLKYTPVRVEIKN